MNIKELFLPDTSVRNPTGVFTLTGTEMALFQAMGARAQYIEVSEQGGISTVKSAT